jgi:hypothetical protein
MDDFYTARGGWPMDLEFKPDFDQAIRRVYAWYEGEMLDRPPVWFGRDAAVTGRRDPGAAFKASPGRWPTLKDCWFDTEFIVGDFVRFCEHTTFNGETFPVYYPFLGPNVFAACYEGVEYQFGDDTAWTLAESDPDGGDFDYTPPRFDWGSPYLRQLDEMTAYALDQAQGRFMVGYTDIHPGMDWAVGVKGNDPLLFGLIEDPEGVTSLVDSCLADFLAFFERYDRMLKAAGQLSVTWMGLPSYGRWHVPSCDFSAMISPDHFQEFAYPGLKAECETMTHNIFHVDGPGVARHTDAILTLPNVKGIQWVQGAGETEPILQWVPYIQKIQEAGVGIVVSLKPEELDPLMAALRPEGLFLCVLPTQGDEQEHDILRRVARWGR